MELATSLSSVEPTPGLLIGIYLLLNTAQCDASSSCDEWRERWTKMKIQIRFTFTMNYFSGITIQGISPAGTVMHNSAVRGWLKTKRKKTKKYFEFPLSHQICSHWWAPHLPTLLPGCCNSTALWLNFTKFHYLFLTFTKLHCLCLTFTKFHCLCLTFLKSRPTSLTIALVAVNLLGLTQGMLVIRWL